MKAAEELEHILDAGREALERGSLEVAREVLKKARKLDDQDRDVMLFAIAVELSDGREEEATEALEALVDAHGDDPVALVAASGLVFDLDGDPEQALELAEEAEAGLSELAKDPEERELAEEMLRQLVPHLSRCLLALDDREAAVDAAERGTKLAPESPAAWIALGHASFSLTRLDEARAAFARAAQLDSEDAESRWCLGWVERLAGNSGPAGTAFAEAAALAPEDFHVPSEFTEKDVRDTYAEIVAELDPALASLLEGVSLTVEGTPPLERDGDGSPTLLLQVDERPGSEPVAISAVRVYRANLEVAARDLDALGLVLSSELADELIGFVDGEPQD